MPSDDRLWRDRLARVADEADPPSFATDRVRARVRRRRGLLAAGTGVASIMVLSLVTVAAAGIVGGGDPTTGTGASPGPSTPTGPTATAKKEPGVYVCGDRYDHVVPTPGSLLTAEVSSVVKVKTDSGPAVTVTFAATRAVHVASSPPSLFQVLYLKDGVIVGGGPMVNRPGDPGSQGIDAIRGGFDLAPGKPHELQLGPREMLCPSLTWPDIWATPDRYEVAVMIGPVEDRGDELLLNVPLPPAAASLVMKAALPG
ncbi:hypothetical protein ACIA3K_26915 [Micromonospora sp. NPDC051543]|uniref:hypothetical protein n=1 Tax=Micromonospora sp. NPDC051543 TaxID=3364287 RepID=UPI0037966B76